MSKETGGPAFPVVELDRTTGNVCDQHFGVTLRDYFAAKALAAMISKDNKEGTLRGASGVSHLALFAYEYADAMLEARKS